MENSANLTAHFRAFLGDHMTPESDSSRKALGNSRTDQITALLKGAAGAVPIAGGFLSELVGQVIPNQRQDRLESFVLKLEAKVQSMGAQTLDSKLQDAHASDLAREVLQQAVDATSDERLQYLASLLAHGLAGDAISPIESKHILRILGDLNDIEVIWLRFYLNPVMNGDREFRQAHKHVLEPIRAHLGSSREDLDKDALQKSYKSHLAQLGLLEPQYETHSGTRQPIHDPGTGAQRLKSYRITTLGKLLLRQIDLQMPPAS